MHIVLAIAWIGLAVLPPICSAQSPYAGQETRSIKALSDQQIDDLRAGLGMSLALAAELNGYPGPRHTLDLASELGLSHEQRRKVEELFAQMKAASIPIGERLIAEEAELDSKFARRTINEAEIDAATRAIGATQAILRATHLKYHLLTLNVLTPAQTRRYLELRGYARDLTPPHDPSMHRAPH